MNMTISNRIRTWWNRRPEPIWFVCQVDREHQVLGIRGVFLSEDSARIDLGHAKCEHYGYSDPDWPIWVIIEREAIL